MKLYEKKKFFLIKKSFLYFLISCFQVKLGLSLPDTGDMKDLIEALTADTGIKEMLLLEIDGEGFHRTFSGKE